MIWALLAIIFVDLVFIVIMASGARVESKPIARLEKFFKWEESKKEKREFKLNRNGIQLFVRNVGKALVRMLLLERLRVRMEHDLERADIPIRGEELLLFIFSSAAVAYFIAIFLTKNVWFSLFMAPAIFIMVRIIIGMRIKKRLETINEQLGDALDMMASSLRAGYSFNQAMETVGKEMPKPISGEFRSVVKETAYGLSMDDSLDKMLVRVPLEDLELAVTAVKIQRQIGGNLAEILDNISGTIRQRIQLKGEVRALTAQGRLSGIIASAAPIFLAVSMYLNSPENIKLLFTDSFGQRLLILGVIGQLLGFIFIRRVINIKF